jgi:hypothetical protein
MRGKPHAIGWCRRGIALSAEQLAGKQPPLILAGCGERICEFDRARGNQLRALCLICTSIRRIERNASDGAVRVWFDDMSKPIMTGEEKGFGPGAIGFGTFDDTGKVANIRIWAIEKPEAKPLPPFPAAK